MNRLRRSALVLLAAGAGLGLVAVAAPADEIPWTLLSPWSLGRGGYYASSTFSYLSTGSYYDAIGEKRDDPGGKYRDFTAQLHLEYGISKIPTVIGGIVGSLGTPTVFFHLPVRSLRQQFDGAPDLTTSGIGDITLGYRSQWGGALPELPFALGMQAEFQIPTGYNATVVTPPLGDGKFSFTPRLCLGRTVASLAGFAQLAGGYRFRNVPFANQLLLNADAGGWVSRRLLATAHWEWVEHTGPGDIEDYFKGGLALRHRAYKTVDVTGGVFRTFGGQNTEAGTQLFVGISYKGNGLGKYDGMMSSSMDVNPAEDTAPAPAPEAPPAPPAPAPTPPGP